MKLKAKTTVHVNKKFIEIRRWDSCVSLPVCLSVRLSTRPPKPPPGPSHQRKPNTRCAPKENGNFIQPEKENGCSSRAHNVLLLYWLPEVDAACLSLSVCSPVWEYVYVCVCVCFVFLCVASVSVSVFVWLVGWLSFLSSSAWKIFLISLS